MFGSRFRHTTSSNQQGAKLPTKSEEKKSSKSSRHVSGLGKRASRSLQSSEDAHSSTSTTKQTVVAPAKHRGQYTVLSQPTAKDIAGALRPVPPPSTIRTPSLVSGSTASTLESPRYGGLRRKSPDKNNYIASGQIRSLTGKSAASAPRSQTYPDADALENTVLGIALPSTKQDNPSLDLPAHGTGIRLLDHHELPEVSLPLRHSPVAHRHTASTTPSTRYTDSPFSHVHTPSSASSYSPTARAATKGTSVLSLHQSPADGLEDKQGSMLSRSPLSRQATPTPPFSKSTEYGKLRHLPFGVPPQRAATEPPLQHSTNAAARSSARAKEDKRSVKLSGSQYRRRGPKEIPPELAHLNVEAPRKPSLNKPLPPVRPSRDGTPVLEGVIEPSPVVRSDLSPLYTTFHKRTPSQEINAATVPSGIRSRFGFSSKTSSSQPSSRAGSAASQRSALDIAPMSTVDKKATSSFPSGHRRRQDSPALDPAPSPSKTSRFGFFGRKPKPDAPTSVEKPKRQPKRGPAAGTGHEGYGRFGFRGRSGSVVSAVGQRTPSSDSSASRAESRSAASRKISFGSSADGSDLDEFLRERLNPVILRGTGDSGAHRKAEEVISNVPEQNYGSSIENTGLHITRLGTDECIRGFDDCKPLVRSAAAAQHVASNMHSKDTESRTPSSIQDANRVNPSYDVPTERESRPENPTRRRVDSIIINDSGTLKHQMTDHATVQHPANDSHTQGRNFLQRAQASPKLKGKLNVSRTDKVTKTPMETRKSAPIAHYAFPDSHESIDLDELQDIVQDSETSIEDSASEDVVLPKVVPYDRRHSGLLPSPPRTSSARFQEARRGPTFQAAPSQIAITKSVEEELEARPVASLPTIGTPEMGDPSHSPRLPRLSPVGRIPKVVSKRDRDRKLSDHSFSRPFFRAQPRPSVQPPGVLYNQIRDLASPLEVNSQAASSTAASAMSEIALGQSESVRPHTSLDAGGEFFSLPPRQSSEFSYSSSSGIGSWMAALSSLPQTEDVWNEYDELINQVHTSDPHLSNLSSASSLGAPFQYSDVLAQPARSLVPPPLQWSQPPSLDRPLPPPPRSNITRAAPQTVGRSLAPSPFPQVQVSSSQPTDFMSGYTRNSMYCNAVSPNAATTRRASSAQSTQQSLTSIRGSQSSSRYSQASSHSRSASLPGGGSRDSQLASSLGNRFQKNTQLLDVAESEGTRQRSSANLRFAALMTSKWLSFGQVLFSPAHNEMRLAEEPKVLVIDGLGADWSYYVALTYPMANVYNLGPSPTDGSSHWPGVSRQPPSNHRHINHSTISASFPFPKGFFTAVVLRFPAVTKDQAYQNCIYECKRVLRPGGHLEISALDLDLMNMASRTRKAVRGLKTRMQQRDSDVSLRNLSDTLVYLIARRGFGEVQRCVVGVPAAGRIPRSQDASPTGSGSGSGSGSSARGVWQPETASGSEEEFSFADLLKDACASRIESDRQKDEGITKMVAKVGRWWYSACYERPLVHNDKSIWDDSALLRECEKQGTSFRMLICCAQKPAQPRRTVSV